MATQRKHRRAQRRRGGRFFRVYVLISALLIVAAMVAGSIVFFKAHTFEVEGNARYTQEELLASAGIQDGENLLTIPRREIARRMEEELPYLKEVNIALLPPERVVIRVEETTAAAAVAAGEVYWLIDSSGKLLERVEAAENSPTVTGLTLLAPSAGTRLAVEEEESLKSKGLLALLTALEEKALLSEISAIDLTSGSTVSMLYQGRLTVKMGLADDFAYDLKMLQASEEQYILSFWTDEDTGTLDMTREEGQAILSKD